MRTSTGDPSTRPRFTPSFHAVLTSRCGRTTIRTGTNSGSHCDVCIDLMASSAVNFPMISARLRSFVVWIGVGSIRCTYSGVRLPLRCTRTTNLVCVMVVILPLICYGRKDCPLCAGVAQAWQGVLRDGRLGHRLSLFLLSIAVAGFTSVIWIQPLSGYT